MAPGPKKRNFHTPRNAKNTAVPKHNEKKNVESNNEANKTVDINSNLSKESDVNQKSRYSKRTVESNWNKYEEPVNDPHADSLRGRDFNVLLSYSGGSGSQLKLQNEKEWEDDYIKDISLDIPDLISAMKCIPFHERIGLQNAFDENIIINFIENSKKCAVSYESQAKSQVSKCKEDLKEILMDTDPILNIIEEPDSLESGDFVAFKNVTVQDKTEEIINSLASNLSFQNFDKNEEKVCQTESVEEKKSEPASNDLDFLLSLNISSKISVNQENVTAPKNANVDDWLDSILDD